MKTYTFKIKVDIDKVVVAVNMQLEQFFDSVKMTNFESLIERYPHAYITACDYYSGDDFVKDDFCLSTLKTLINSKDLKSYLLNPLFYGFVGDDSFSSIASNLLIDEAHKFIENEKNIVEDEEVKEDELSETNKE